MLEADWSVIVIYLGKSTAMTSSLYFSCLLIFSEVSDSCCRYVCIFQPFPLFKKFFSHKRNVRVCVCVC